MNFRNSLFPLTFLASASISLGSGYHLQERSSAGLGRAFAGEAAIAEDASSMATNPANMLLLEGPQYSIGAAHYRPTVKVQGNLGNVDNAAESATAPYSYLTHKLNDKVALGIGAHSRFGLSTHYPEDFGGRVHADESRIETYYLTPKIAYKLSDKWLVGAGLDFIYTKGTLSNTFPTTANPLIADKHIFEVEGDDFTFGYNLGVTYQATDATRLALAFRSDVELNMTGNVLREIPPSPAIYAAELSTKLPASLEFSALHEFNDAWALHGSATWTKWSNFDALFINADNPANDIGPSAQNWKNTFRVAVGATYKHSDKWTFRAGTAFDESPVRSAEFRYLRIPDADRIWASIGATYQLNESSSMDFGYTHIFSSTVELAADHAMGPIPAFNGTSESSVNLFALSYNKRY